jgi:ribonucleoside-diphosphate reductase alpha chain
MIAECSSGIEPRFAARWNKDVMLENGVVFADEDLLMIYSSSTQFRETMRWNRFEARNLPICSCQRRSWKSIGMRTIFQENAVSKTVNLPQDCTVTDISAVFTQAWNLGCKGSSVYRQDSRQRDSLSVIHAETEPEPTRQSKRLAMT